MPESGFNGYVLMMVGVLLSIRLGLSVYVGMRAAFTFGGPLVLAGVLALLGPAIDFAPALPFLLTFSVGLSLAVVLVGRMRTREGLVRARVLWFYRTANPRSRVHLLSSGGLMLVDRATGATSAFYGKDAVERVRRHGVLNTIRLAYAARRLVMQRAA